MNDKDTVMSKEERSLIRAHWLRRKDERVVHDDLMRDVAKAQAKITWSIAFEVGYEEAKKEGGFVEWCHEEETKND